jgi:hypothetical protein
MSSNTLTGGVARMPGLMVLMFLVLLPFPARVRAAPAYLLQRPLVTAKLAYERKDEQRTRDSTTDRSLQSDTFLESIEVLGAGWWYHPNLLTFKYGIEPEWRQRATDATHGLDRNDDLNFFGYFLDADILREKPQSLELYLTQRRNTFDSSISPSNDTDTTAGRLTWRLKEYAVPTNVSIARLDTHTRNLYDTREASDSLRIDSKHEVDRSLTSLIAEYIDQDRDVNTAESTVERLLINARNRFQLRDNADLHSAASYRDSTLTSETRSVVNRQTVLSERLYLTHSDTLRSNYEVRLENRKQDEFQIDTLLGRLMLQHQLYENLESTLELESRQDDTSDGQIDRLEGDLDFRYTRRIPGGRLNLFNGYRYRLEDNDIDAVISQVVNEVVVTNGTEPQFLNREAIDVDSIIVKDETAAVVYVEGIDYVIVQVGTSVAIQPSLLGGIGDSQKLLVDYAFAAQAPHKIGRTGVRLGGSIRLWNALRLFYSYARTKDDLKSGIRPSTLADDTVQRVGAEFKWAWSTTFVEYLDQDTVRVPFDRLRIMQTISFQPAPNLSFGFSAGYSDTNFKEESGSDTEGYDVGANLRWQIASWNHLQASAIYQKVDGEAQRTKAVGITALWAWRYGDWSGSVRFLSNEQDDSLIRQSVDRSLFTVKVERVFR